MKWARFGALVASIAPCVGMRGDHAIVAVGGCPCHCDRHRSLVELLCQFFRGAIVALILQKPPRSPTLCFRDLDYSGASFPVRECMSRIEYHDRSAPAGQQIV
jgi:hypothetical protein